MAKGQQKDDEMIQRAKMCNSLDEVIVDTLNVAQWPANRFPREDFQALLPDGLSLPRAPGQSAAVVMVLAITPIRKLHSE